MEMEKNYDHKLVEQGKFEMWNSDHYFQASYDVNDPKTPFSMIVPPPNITGVLHIGHALDTTIYDIFARYKKLHGYDVFFCPGTDHAGIATQAKVEANLREKNITRFDLGRKEFVKEVYKWKDQTSSTIHKQWAALGIGMDYSKERFTMDEKTNQAVLKVFKQLYDEGLIYQGERIINWDVQLQTALSNIEVEHKDIPGKFYYFKYRLADNPEKYFEIATTRPETMFGDVCVVFNPKDTRYTQYEGKYVINPANGEKLIMLGDYYVDKDFGTGLMKCTPAHDPNDFNIAKRHNLKMPVCMNKDGTMNAICGKYEGQDRYECRDNLVEQISSQGDLIKIDDIVHSVGHSERSHTVVEPYLSKQWFIKMEPLAKRVLELQKDKKTKINFFPSRFEKIFIQWLKNTEDWCISRQLWWGHRIPIYTNKQTGEVICSVTELDPNLYDQDEDVLDTWFSSGLSPFVLCNWPDMEDSLYKRYYPLNLMITGYDILFFWVARMAFDGAHFTNHLPFKNCFLHGLVRDSQGRKMSKSLGNGIDPIKVIDEYGADSLRYALATAVTPGLDMSFGMDKIVSSHTFLNKIWNASRFALMNFKEDFVYEEDITKLDLNFVDLYVLKHLNSTIKNVERNFDKYEIGQAANYLYLFIYDVFCSNYIEEIKADLDNPSRRNTALNVLLYVLKSLLSMLFPYAPFISEEIYSYLPNHKKSIYLEKYPSVIKIKNSSLGDNLVSIVKEIRSFKADNKLPLTYKVDLNVCTSKANFEKLKPYLLKVGMLKSINLISKNDVDNHYRFITKNIGLKVFSDELAQANKARVEKRIAELKAEIERSTKMLSNPNFVNKAPKAKVDLEKQKLENYQHELDNYLK